MVNASRIMVLVAPTVLFPRGCLLSGLARRMLRWPCMSPWRLRVVLPVLLTAGALSFACSDMSLSTSASDRSPGDGSGAADAGAFSPAPNAGSDKNPDLLPTDNAVILVHAAGMPAFRLCFQNQPELLPAPDQETMPDANVVGVEVGSAVRIAPLSREPGEIYVFNESLVRDYAGEGVKCGDLIQTPLFNTAYKMPAIKTDYAKGVHLLVLKGCQGPTAVKYTKAECGSDYEPDDTSPANAKGNLAFLDITLTGAERDGNALPTQVLHLSQALEGQRNGAELAVTFGDVTTSDAFHASKAIDPKLFDATPQSLLESPSFNGADDAVYANVGFRVSLKSGANAPTVVAQQSLADVQKLSAPREIPSTYYSAASNYVLLLLGSPAPRLLDGGPDSDPRKNVHLLAVPVIDPDKADGGADGGNAIDGGAADGGT